MGTYLNHGGSLLMMIRETVHMYCKRLNFSELKFSRIGPKLKI
ncbi:MAG: hypothetical protein PV344_02825 [Anaplasma sp.]|nr:hypothetical protein [Anaplasma sp.]